MLVVVASVAGAAEPDPLRVGMDTRSRPWAYVPGLDYSREDWSRAPVVSEAQLKRIEGVEIDVMDALAARLKRPVVIVPWAWADIEGGLLAGRFDVILNAWVPNDRTPSSIVASAPYYDWGLQIAVRADDSRIGNYQDLSGRRVGHYKDRVVDLSVASLGASALLAVDDSDKLFDELAAGLVDAVVEDSTYVRWKVGVDPRFKAVGDRLNRMSYHLALRRADRALLESVNAAIRELRVSGEIDRIRKKWEPRAPQG